MRVATRYARLLPTTVFSHQQTVFNVWQRMASKTLNVGVQPASELLSILALQAAVDVGLQFRLYRQTSGNRALLQRVDLPQDTLDKVQHAHHLD